MNQLVEQLPCAMELAVGDTVFMVGLFYEDKRETLHDTIERLIKKEVAYVSDE